MSSALGYIYSLPFAVGAVSGALTMKIYQWQHCRALDRAHPLPNGVKRRVPGISQQFWGGLIALLVVGYVLLQVGQTEQRYTQLADSIANCTTDLISSIGDSRRVNDERDNLSEEQRALGLKIDNATAQLIRTVLSPPPEIAYLPPEGRRVWTDSVQREYDKTTAPWRARSAEIEATVSTLVTQRRPLPDPRCAHP